MFKSQQYHNSISDFPAVNCEWKMEAREGTDI